MRRTPAWMEVMLLLGVLCSTADAQSPTTLEPFEGDIDADWGLIAGDYSVDLADALVAAGVVTAPPPDARRRELGITTSTSVLWNDRRADGKIYIPLVYSSAFSAAQQTTIRNAANTLASNVGVLQFVDRTTEAAYIEFVDGSGCSSRIGRSGSRQVITLQSNGCVYTGTIQHEIMHAIGFWHEQSRSDRDDYVTINLANVEAGKEHNFDKRSTRSLGSAYDYGSVMHYGRTAFSSNGQETIVAPQAIGQRSGPSASDIEQIQLLYGVGITPAPTTAKPTTAKPTTAKPTTAKPTTAKPTTAKPTTAQPTTAKPTTAKPTTAKPTAKPTTAEPTLSPSRRPSQSPTQSPSAAPTLPVCSAADFALWRAGGPQDVSENPQVRACAAGCGAVPSATADSCVAACVQVDPGYTASCAACFGGFVGCLADDCDGCAITAAGLTANCTRCEARETCLEAFKACTEGFEVRSLPDSSQDDARTPSVNVGLVAGIGAGFVLTMLALSGAFVVVRRRANERRTRALTAGAVGRFGPVAVANPVYQDQANRKFFNVNV